MNVNGEKMILDKKLYDNYVKILENELVPALGCTEPIAIAYAAAKAREVLGEFPDYVEMRCSGNIIKNVKCKKTKKCRKRTKQNRKHINKWSRNGN